MSAVPAPHEGDLRWRRPLGCRKVRDEGHHVRKRGADEARLPRVQLVGPVAEARVAAGREG